MKFKNDIQKNEKITSELAKFRVPSTQPPKRPRLL